MPDKMSKLFFLHIPKAGGTTFYDIIYRNFAYREVAKIDGTQIEKSIAEGISSELAAIRERENLLETKEEKEKQLKKCKGDKNNILPAFSLFEFWLSEGKLKRIGGRNMRQRLVLIETWNL